jgi:hydrogenase-4 component F
VILLVMLGIPLLAAALSAARGTRPFAPAFTVVSAVTVFALASGTALRMTGAGAPVAIAVPGLVSMDGLSALIVWLIALVATTAAIYSWGYMGRTCVHEPARLRLYYANYNLFVFAMLAIPMVVEPTLVWIFVELTTLSSALLVSFENTREALEAAWKYVALSLMGAAIALLGFLMLFAALRAAGGETYTWSTLLDAAPRMPPALLKTAFVLIVVGLGTKVGLVPLHTWLPDAHSQAPSPVCALLSGIETTSVLYVILRLLPVVNAAPLAGAANWMIALGLLSAGVAAFLLLQVRDYKRLFAFSTVEHMGIILVAAGLASSAAHYGAMYQVVSHAVTKSFCFFAAGAALLTVTTREIASVRGLIRTSPMAAASLLLGGLAIAGAPPLAVFLSEFSILRAGLAEGQYLVTGLLTLSIAIAFFGVLLHINSMVFGEGVPSAAPTATGATGRTPSLRLVSACVSSSAPVAAATERRDLPRTCIAILIIGGAIVIALGLYLPAPLDALLRLASSTLQR